MNYLEELCKSLDEAGMPYEVVQDPRVQILTNIGYFTQPLTSIVDEEVADLLCTCCEYTKVWIYSVEPLAVSGKLMMRFAWVK
ncbi:hypothetical protein PP427_gp154 [Salmonella phage KM16]|uniref:hypothetical protein n=1 Tax=Salmonella phage KM16 TaxID=2797303 RepID=UPI002491BC6C|nr:hypothetical protein PP427_gp154 [Salmonella phage KM16]